MPAASIPKILCATALAIMAGAVVFARLADDGSMLGAILRVEDRRIDKATRRDIERARNAEIRRVPDREAYFATRQVLELLSEAASETFDWQAGVQEAANEVAKDVNNLVARLAYAVLLDMYKMERTSGSITPQQRAQGIREIADTTPPAAESTFHHTSLLKAWNGVLGDYYKRPDVAASLASKIGHHETLLLVCGHLLELRSLLSERGAAEDAEACTRWLVECLGGLMLSETDAETRLLCADLIARTAGADSKLGRDMHAMRRAYHEAAKRGPVDHCDQAFSSRPSIAPGAYRRAMWLLVACVGTTAAAVGGAVSLLAVCLIAPIARRLSPDRAFPLPMARPWWGRLPLALLPTGVCVSAIAIQVDRHGFYSQNWAILVGLAAVGVGVLTTILLASYCTARGEGTRRIRRVVPWFILAAFVALPLLPPAFVTRVYRGLDLAAGGVWVGPAVVIGSILLAKWFAPARWGTFASTGALVACLHVCLALGFCFWHVSADEQYQQAAVKGHADEVAARLGPDWRSAYLGELLRAYEVPGERQGGSRQ